MPRLDRILMIDNFDSFTYNLVDYFRTGGCKVATYRNTIDPSTLLRETFDLLVLSPGPSVPSKAGNLMKIIETFHAVKPVFGVCLGHQAIIEFFGGTLGYREPRHGKADLIRHDGLAIYSGLASPFEAGRYHSLSADVVPDCLKATAWSPDGIVMSVRHKSLPIEGVQFHPESVLSMKEDAGRRIIRNVVNGKMGIAMQTKSQ